MAILQEAKWTADFVVSLARGNRSLETLIVPQGEASLQPGALLAADGTAAGAAGDIAGILWALTDPSGGPVRVTIVARDAEVNDAYLVYGEIAREAANTALAQLGIIVRAGVLAQSIPTPFGGLNQSPATAAASASEAAARRG